MEQARAAADGRRASRKERPKPVQSTSDGVIRQPVNEGLILRLQRDAGNLATADLLHGLGPEGLLPAPTVSRATATKADPAVAAIAKATRREAYDQWFARHYEQISKSEGSLHDSLKAYLLLVSRADRVFFYRGLERETGELIDPPVFKEALDGFSQTTGNRLVGRILKEPNALEKWKGMLGEFAHYLDDGEKGTEFREAVEDKLLKAYAAADAQETGKSPKQLQELADVQVKPIIEHYMNVMEFGATQAAGAWKGLPLPKKGGSSAKTEVAASAVDFAKEAAEIILKHGTALAEIAIPELAIIKFGLELVGIVQAEAEQEEWEEKLQLKADLDARAKHELLRMYNTIYAQAYERQDVLAILATSRALKAGIRPEAANKTKLREFVRVEVFGKDFSDNPSITMDIATRRLEEISHEYAERVSG